MKIIAKIDSDTYYQSVMFNISATPLMTIGSNVITVQKFGQVMVFNVILIVVILMVIISLIIIEFKRYVVYRPIDESLLKSKGYFTK
jgi:cell division protein FtsL